MLYYYIIISYYCILCIALKCVFLKRIKVLLLLLLLLPLLHTPTHPHHSQTYNTQTKETNCIQKTTKTAHTLKHTKTALFSCTILSIIFSTYPKSMLSHNPSALYCPSNTHMIDTTHLFICTHVTT